jgi:chromate transporter
MFLTFAKIGAFSFGGGYAMIPLMKKEVVSLHGWLTIQEMIDIIAISQMTPGPIAINLATFVGYKIADFPGALAATVGVITPSLIIITVIARFFFKFQNESKMQWVLGGIRPVVVALVAFAALVIGNTALHDVKGYLITAIAFIAVFIFKIHPILVIISSGILGIMLY